MNNQKMASELLKVARDLVGGCEKLPEGPMRDNCEKKKKEAMIRRVAGKSYDTEDGGMVTEDEISDYLEDLRDSGATNMMGAGKYLQREMGLSRRDAKSALLNWMKNFRGADRTAGCEKLPEGPMRDNCEKKKKESRDLMAGPFREWEDEDRWVDADFSKMSSLLNQLDRTSRDMGDTTGSREVKQFNKNVKDLLKQMYRLDNDRPWRPKGWDRI